MIISIVIFLLITFVSSQEVSITDPIDENKIRKQLKIDGIINTQDIELTTEMKKDGMIETIKQLPSSFEIKGSIESDGIGKGFALWFSKEQIYSGNIYGGRVNINDNNRDDKIGVYVKVSTDIAGDVVSLNRINDNSQLNHCKFSIQANKKKIDFIVTYDYKSMKFTVQLNTDKEICSIETTIGLSSTKFAITAQDEKHGGKHKLKSLEIIDPKKVEHKADDLLKEGDEKLNYEFIESELFGSSDKIETALQKLYTILGRVYSQAMQLDKLNTENERLLKIVINGAKHLNEMLQNQELVIDTSDIQFDIQTFQHRLNAIESITRLTFNDLRHVLGINNNTNTKILKRNEQSSHPVFWFLFISLQVGTLLLTFNLLRIKLIKKERKEL